MKRYHVTTFGCQMNEHDSERMKGMLESLGYREADARADADLILFNTCSIREKADERFLAHLGEAKRAEARGSRSGSSASAAAGPSRSRTRSSRSSRSSTSPSAPARCTSSPSSSRRTRSPPRGSSSSRASPATCPPSARATFQAWVQISVGCNMVVLVLHRAVARAAARSRGRSSELVAEVERLAADGVREVTLLGQNVNSYGRDLRPQRASFAELLRALDAIEGIDRIRYTSPHPKDMREDVVRAHAELPTRLRAHPPAAAGRLVAHPQGDAPHVRRASATSTASR